MGIEGITTSTNPSKTYISGCGCDPKPNKADNICALLEEILGCFKDIKIGDVTLNVDLTEVKACLDDILACLNEVKVDIKSLCEKVANLESLLEANNLLLGEIKECITKMHTEIVECLNELKLSNTEILECLKELKLSATETVECLQAIKLTQAKIIQCLKDLKLETNDEVIACLQDLKAKATANPTIWGVQEDCNWWDNQVDGENFSGLLLSQDTHEVTLTMNTGRTCKFIIPGTVAQDYDTQFDNILAALKQCTGKDWELNSSPRDGDLNTALARHAKTTCCPGDEYIVSSKSITIGGKRDGRQLTQLTGYDKGELSKFKQYDCGPEVPAIWTDMAGVIVEAPELTCAAIDCKFPQAGCCGFGATACEVKRYGPLQDCDLTTEPPTTFATDIYMDVETCDGVENAPFYYTLTDEGQEVYELQGQLADAEKNLFEPPASEDEVTLADFKVIKNIGAEGNYDGAFAITRGRPNPNVPWELLDHTEDPAAPGIVLASGATFQEFVTDAESKGYSEFIVGEIHYLCPCPLQLKEAGDLSVAAGGDTQTKPVCTPLEKLGVAAKAPQVECALRVIDCNPRATIDKCCTGGATETTAKCANISKLWTTMSLGDFDTCTASFGGIDLPNDNYEFADFEALITGVGGTIEPNPDNPDQYTICVPDGFRTCYDRACFKDRVGQLTRACVIALPNTSEEVCKDFQRTWGKYEEPIGNTLATSLDVQQQMLDKLCQSADDAAMSAAKLCLIEEHTNPAAPCPVEVPPEGLNKELQTLTIAGDKTANYPAGQSVNLQNANGESCGSATVSNEVATVFNEETNQTVITFQECELEEGKAVADIKQATAVKATTLIAIKTIKTLAVTGVTR